jgi:phosphohistidine phosphatase
MKLYLIQHAEAMRKEEDPDRPLTEQGRSDAQAVGAFLASKDLVQLDAIFHSGKTRAQQTAELFGASLRPEKGVKVGESLRALDDPASWAERLRDSEGEIMLVGHLPYMSKIAALLLCGDPKKSIVEFTNAGVVCLQREGEGEWALKWAVTPALAH